MERDWERQFNQWAQPPSQTEQDRCKNAITGIKRTIEQSPLLSHRRIEVFAQGSYRNRVNIPSESDVDVGVLCHEAFYAQYPLGKRAADYGNEPAAYNFAQFKNELGEALRSYFRAGTVVRGNKAFTVRATSHHVEADVVPFFEHRHYTDNGAWLGGVTLIPDSGGRVDNYPERLLSEWPQVPLHYENGVAKNDGTSRRFKGAVRILKHVAAELRAAGDHRAANIPGFLVECLVWNASDTAFKGETWDERIQAVLLELWSRTKEDGDSARWTEIDGVKILFDSTQKWTREQANNFVLAAWSHVGIR